VGCPSLREVCQKARDLPSFPDAAAKIKGMFTTATRRTRLKSKALTTESTEEKHRQILFVFCFRRVAVVNGF
jgi:hypothetical protein